MPDQPLPFFKAREVREILARVAGLDERCETLRSLAHMARDTAEVAYGREMDRAIRHRLARMPLGELKRTGMTGLRLGALADAGMRTVADLMHFDSHSIESVRGIGPATASNVMAAAARCVADVSAETRVRFDFEERPQSQTRLLDAIRSWDEARNSAPTLTEGISELHTECIEDARTARVLSRGLRHLMLGKRRRADAYAAADRLHRRLDSAEAKQLIRDADRLMQSVNETQNPDALWHAYESRAVVFNGYVAEIEESTTELGHSPQAETLDRSSPYTETPPQGAGGPANRGTLRRDNDHWDPSPGARQSAVRRKPRHSGRSSPGDPPRDRRAARSGNGDPSRGFLPRAIARAVEQFELDTSLMRANLRGYQHFGAQFAARQTRAIIGDEMGLGKTLEALALICHLAARGETRFLIVCPASVLTNWEREADRHTSLPSCMRLHGPQRERLRHQWERDGGVAITTYDTLRLLAESAKQYAALIVDEAHFIKNPSALRTQAVARWTAKAEHVLFLSGTPMENRLREFRHLIGLLDPKLSASIGDDDDWVDPGEFRRRIAPVYLRRNQADVLNELPDKIEVPEWLTLEGAAARSYQRAVASGNFMLMRRAAFLTPDPMDSPKLRRLLEIVDDAAANGRKVVVFSFFLEVLDRICAAAPVPAFGPLTGAMAPPQRLALIDEFSGADGPGVLVSQIEAGGTGLNIQAASVVILAEPQWKPSSEEQAIARSHRLGQVRHVEVHRLLTENSVDEYMVSILARKSELFATYARESAIKTASAAAVDAAELGRHLSLLPQHRQVDEIIRMERERLAIAS